MRNREAGFGIIEIMTIILVVGILGYIGFQIYLNVNQTAANIPVIKYSEVPDADSEDPEKDELKWKRHYGLHSRLLTYRVSRQTYPVPTAAGWKEITDMPIQGNGDTKNDVLIDPYTDTMYKFTLTAPDYGEIQYKFPSSCDDDYRQFAPAKSSQNYAFRLKFSDGVRCSSNE